MPPRPGSILAAKSAKCDEAVTTLLTTRDIVEMERAKFLISWFDCNLSRRLPR